MPPAPPTSHAAPPDLRVVAGASASPIDWRAVNRLEVNATINLLRSRGLLPQDYAASVEVDDLIAHVYDACARNGVGATALRREVEALLRERAPRRGP